MAFVLFRKSGITNLSQIFTWRCCVMVIINKIRILKGHDLLRLNHRNWFQGGISTKILYGLQCTQWVSVERMKKEDKLKIVYNCQWAKSFLIEI